MPEHSLIHITVLYETQKLSISARQQKQQRNSVLFRLHYLHLGTTHMSQSCKIKKRERKKYKRHSNRSMIVLYDRFCPTFCWGSTVLAVSVSISIIPDVITLFYKLNKNATQGLNCVVCLPFASSQAVKLSQCKQSGALNNYRHNSDFYEAGWWNKLPESPGSIEKYCITSKD